MDCIFCKIVNKEVPSNILLESDSLIVFPDISPKAPVHLLVVSKTHIASAYEIDESNSSLIGQMILAAKQMADANGIAERGYKLVFNIGREGGQTIPHLHMHILGGKSLGE